MVIPNLVPLAQGLFMTECIADLLLISITIAPRDVERVLDARAGSPHSINADLEVYSPMVRVS